LIKTALPDRHPGQLQYFDHTASALAKDIARKEEFDFLEVSYSVLYSYPFHRKGTPMRWIHLAVIAAFGAATVLFAVQNFEIVTMSFLGFNARAPLALLVGIVGMATGGSLWALLRRSFHGSQLVKTQ